MKNIIIILQCALMVIALAGCNKKPNRNVTRENTHEQAITADRATDLLMTPVPQDLIPVTGPTVVDFFATWCGPCKELTPLLELLEKKYQGQVNFICIDVDQNPELAMQFQVESVPTLFFITSAGVVDATIGLVSQEQLEAQIQAMLALRH